MALRTLIHVGQHKTGTTSIQHYLQAHRLELQERGLYVPDVLAGHDHPSHFVLNAYALDKDRYSTMKDHLIAERGLNYIDGLKGILEADIRRHYDRANDLGCKDFLITNEGLYLLNSDEEYFRLTELFSKYSLEIVCVCCFREMTEYRKSYMKQLLTQGLSLSTIKDSYRYVEPDSWLFDFVKKKSMLCRAFDNVVFFSYSADDMVKRFMQKIGYATTTGTESFRMNVSDEN